MWTEEWSQRLSRSQFDNAPLSNWFSLCCRRPTLLLASGTCGTDLTLSDVTRRVVKRCSSLEVRLTLDHDLGAAWVFGWPLSACNRRLIPGINSTRCAKATSPAKKPRIMPDAMVRSPTQFKIMAAMIQPGPGKVKIAQRGADDSHPVKRIPHRTITP